MFFSFVIDNQKIVIEKDYDFFEVNNMQNIYTVKGNILTQYSFEGKQKYQYSNFKHGDIFSIDVSDPMRILAFYKDFNQVLFLDNTLSEISEILSLDLIDVNETYSICSSSTGGFWLYNNNQNKLQKYSKTLNLVQEGTNMQDIIDRNISPDFLDEQANNIYLGIKEKGVYIFDIFGTYKNFIPLKYTSIQILENNIYYYKDSVYKYNIKDFETSVLDISIDDFTSFKRVNKSLFVGNNHKIIKVD
jgi:predicted RNA-binding protein